MIYDFRCKQRNMAAVFRFDVYLLQPCQTEAYIALTLADEIPNETECVEIERNQTTWCGFLIFAQINSESKNFLQFSGVHDFEHKKNWPK